ncbi:MAG: M23 family metallopeptidase [Patescibacteria group bacterium]|nr:M23 family metallopeptidase [Patescibacteria group bacterium]
MNDFLWKLRAVGVEFNEWLQEVQGYGRIRLLSLASSFEHLKDGLVDLLMARRGIHQRSFLHAGMILLLSTAAIFAPIIKNDFPSFNLGVKQTFAESPSSVLNPVTSVSQIETSTQISQKPRDKVETYTVKGGDTLSSIAKNFNITVDTIRWANPDSVPTDKTLLHPGDKLQIPPVTGIVHKVKSGDTIYSIAKKYAVSAQNIVNYPFNTFADDETFALAIGTDIIVPDGVMPEEQPSAPVYFQPVTLTAGGTGQFIWPTVGVITQYPVWYHMAVDIANPSAPQVVAADNGVVVLRECIRTGYGCHIIIDHGNGYQTLYAHMQAFYVNLGDHVSRGQAIGQMGSTGRSTGTHLHFEVHKNGAAQNPLNYLR